MGTYSDSSEYVAQIGKITAKQAVEAYEAGQTTFFATHATMQSDVTVQPTLSVLRPDEKPEI